MSQLALVMVLGMGTAFVAGCGAVDRKRVERLESLADTVERLESLADTFASIKLALHRWTILVPDFMNPGRQAQLKPGLDVDEIRFVMGRPDGVETQGNRTTWVWHSGSERPSTSLRCHRT